MLQAPPAAIVSPDVPAAFSIADVGKDRPWKITLVSQRCGRSHSDEIVVCGRRDTPRDRLGTPLPDNPTLMDDVGDKLHLRLGPIEIGSLKSGDSRVLGIRINF
ncbi:MAG TPA: hypothetical protein VH331_01610 [Allosphingosinicella sp.]|nr:hypothetical protein [Allosphingosinicella sp.]